MASKDTLDAIEGLKGHDFEIVRYREERGRVDGLRRLAKVPGLFDQISGRLAV